MHRKTPGGLCTRLGHGKPAGGDEFVVLLSEVQQSEDAANTARRMLQAVAEAHSIDQHELHISTSSISIYPDDGLMR